MKIEKKLIPVPLALFVLLASLGLVACGGDDDVGGASDNEVEVAQPGPVKGEFTFSNWPGYIDKGEAGTIPEFEAEYPGVTVDYVEEINDNAEYFGKLQPQLQQGDSGGRSMLIATDWLAKQMYDLGYLQEIDLADVPNAEANLVEPLRSPDFDPDRSFSVPWASGMTGLLVNEDVAPGIRSVNDLFDPKYAGKVTVLTDLRDTVPLMLKGDGIDPAEATKEQWLEQIEKLQEAVDSGQLRRFTGNDYVQDLTNGNVVASIGWSGDEALIGIDEIQWRMPTEGCLLWSDNMVIPVGAPNTAAALAWMDFVYRPEVQADIAAYTGVVSPVEGIENVDPSLAENELVNPPEEFTADCSFLPDPPGSEEDVAEVTEAFQAVITQ